MVFLLCPLRFSVFSVLCFPFSCPSLTLPTIFYLFFPLPFPQLYLLPLCLTVWVCTPWLDGFGLIFHVLPALWTPGRGSPAGVGWTATGISGRKWHGPGLFGFYSVIFLFQSPPSPSITPALPPCSSPLCLGGVGAGTYSLFPSLLSAAKHCPVLEHRSIPRPLPGECWPWGCLSLSPRVVLSSGSCGEGTLWPQGCGSLSSACSASCAQGSGACWALGFFVFLLGCWCSVVSKWFGAAAA